MVMVQPAFVDLVMMLRADQQVKILGLGFAVVFEPMLAVVASVNDGGRSQPGHVQPPSRAARKCLSPLAMLRVRRPKSSISQSPR
jgi:hypothetical protein